MNSSGHFLMVITNSANSRGCRGEAPARLSKHCCVRLGLVRFGLGFVWVKLGLG